MGSQYLEELRSITLRMDKILPPPHEEREDGTSRSKGFQHAVIEAKPSDVIRVHYPVSSWCFSGDIPPAHQGQKSRRAYVSELTRLPIHIDKTLGITGGGQAPLPDGVNLWHATDDARRIMLLTRRDLDLFFSSEHDKRVPYDKERELVFALPEGKELCFRDAMSLIKEQAPYLHKLCNEYASLAAHIYGLTLKQFGVISRIWVQRLHSQKGTAVGLVESHHARYDGGPVLVIALGLPNVAHDVSPTLMQADQSKQAPTRIFVPEGVMMILDGDARFCYSHGFPGGQEGGKCFYSITICMDCIGQTSITGYERETRTLIMSTPIKMEHVITTRPAIQSQTNIQTTLQKDPLWKIVQSMRTRVRSAESYTIMNNYKQREGAPCGRGLCREWS